jgi:hypothetical protein
MQAVGVFVHRARLGVERVDLNALLAEPAGFGTSGLRSSRSTSDKQMKER